MRSRSITTAVAVLLTVLLVPGEPAVAARRVPAGFKVARGHRAGPGLKHLVLKKRGRGGQVVHVARLDARSKLRIQPVLSQGNRTGRGPATEPTSRLCRRVRCYAAVNGDFFDRGAPAGGVVLDGVPFKGPRRRRVQVSFDEDGRLVSGKLRLTGSVVTGDLRRRSIAGVDIVRKAGRLTLFTPKRWSRTPRARGAVDLVLSVIDPAPPLRVGQTSLVRIEALRRNGRTLIPRGGVVLSGTGNAARMLKGLWRDVRHDRTSSDMLIRLRSNPSAWDSIGAKPVIVRRGRVVVGGSRSSFARGRHPRTLVGRTRDGSTLLVTVDGRQKGRRGMSLREAARLMIRLGAVEAVNLDGGGSTTFVVRGRTVNRPSGGRERSVAVALAVVGPARDQGGPSQPKLNRVALPGTETGVEEEAKTPEPGAARPAVIASATPTGARSTPVGLTVAIVAPIVVLLLTIVSPRRRRRRAPP